jgi:ergothioneine biosynthesis protein EgtB
MELETLTHRRKPRPHFDMHSIEREELLQRYEKVRETTEWLCEPLEVEDCVVQTAMECSPVKWQLGHVTWFFETFVLDQFAGNPHEFNAKYGYLFNSYYNSIGDRTPRDMRGLMSRPTLADVWNYRRHVDAAMEKFIEKSDEATFHQALPIIILGLNHEQQHQELMITDVKTVLAMNPLRPVYRAREITSSKIAPLNWISFDEGLIEIGAYGTEFYFDNEGPRHRQYIEQFELADRLITNGEYKIFMADGGYENPSFWLSDGWAKCGEENWKAPKYWDELDGKWWAMTLQGFRPVEDSEPVTHVSHYEADAFATWSNSRLPTEFEWEFAVNNKTIEGNFLDSGNFHPTPLVPSVPFVPAAPAQMFGDVWQWTRSAYLPYPGYKAAEGALGEYNGKFMSNQIVLRGGSCATPQDHIRATYRNFFPPDARWQFSGIRLAK